MKDIITQILLLPVKIDLDKHDTEILDLINHFIEIQKLDLIDKPEDQTKINNLYSIFKPELYEKFYYLKNIYGLNITKTKELITISFNNKIFMLDIFIIFNFIIINLLKKTEINNKIRHKFKICYYYIKKTKYYNNNYIFFNINLPREKYDVSKENYIELFSNLFKSRYSKLNKSENNIKKFDYLIRIYNEIFMMIKEKENKISIYSCEQSDNVRTDCTKYLTDIIKIYPQNIIIQTDTFLLSPYIQIIKTDEENILIKLLKYLLLFIITEYNTVGTDFLILDFDKIKYYNLILELYDNYEKLIKEENLDKIKEYQIEKKEENLNILYEIKPFDSFDSYNIYDIYDNSTELDNICNNINLHENLMILSKHFISEYKNNNIIYFPKIIVITLDMNNFFNLDENNLLITETELYIYYLDSTILLYIHNKKDTILFNNIIKLINKIKDSNYCKLYIIHKRDLDLYQDLNNNLDLMLKLYINYNYTNYIKNLYNETQFDEIKIYINYKYNLDFYDQYYYFKLLFNSINNIDITENEINIDEDQYLIINKQNLLLIQDIYDKNLIKKNEMIKFFNKYTDNKKFQNINNIFNNIIYKYNEEIILLEIKNEIEKN